MAQRRPRLTVNQASHTEVRVLPGAPYVLVAQWIARVVPNHEVGRSNRPEDTARDSPGERRSAKPPDGFDSRRVSTARRPKDQGSGVLNRQCAFESRRADVVLTFMAQLNIPSRCESGWYFAISLRN